MTDSQDFKPYELNEEDIDKVMNYLKIYDPQNASPDDAIAFIEFMHTVAHQMVHVDKNNPEELYKAFKDHNK